MGFFTTTPEERAKSKAARARWFLFGLAAGINRREEVELKKNAKTEDSDIKEESTD